MVWKGGTCRCQNLVYIGLVKKLINTKTADSFQPCISVLQKIIEKDRIIMRPDITETIWSSKV